MEIVASEPLIASPSAVCWMSAGGCLSGNCNGYNLAASSTSRNSTRLESSTRRCAVCRRREIQTPAKAGTFGVVKLLRDTNGGGRMDAADVWARTCRRSTDSCRARRIIVACAPDIVFLADRDEDGKAETRDVLFTGFPTANSNAASTRRNESGMSGFTAAR